MLVKTNYTCYTCKHPWPRIFNLTQILMSGTRRITQMLWVSGLDVLAAVTTPVLTLLAALAAPTQLLSLHSPLRSKRACHRGGLGSSLSRMQKFFSITSEAQERAWVKLLIFYSPCSLKSRGKKDTACCLQESRWVILALDFFSVTLGFATWEGSEVETSQLGTCAKVGKKGQWLSFGSQQYREFI